MLPSRIHPHFTKLKSGLTKLVWPEPPRNIYIAKKHCDTSVLASVREFAQHLHSGYPVNILVDPRTHDELNLPFVKTMDSPKKFANKVDLVVAMGGDGTILHAITAFKHLSLTMPPVLPFSMGTLGFLLPYDFKDSQRVFDNVYTNQALVAKRSRLRVTMPGSSSVLHALNEVTIHRGGSPHLAELDIAVNGQYLTTAIADGVCVSTPTGSTAYSLSAGGSIVHPGVESILVTPICPRSLSFRPLLFPQNAQISISLHSKARGQSSLSLDGDDNGMLEVGSAVSMEVRPEEGVWCVTQNSETDDWVRHVNGLLGFNSRFGKRLLN